MTCSGSQIRAARAGLGWSREALAERAGVHVKTVTYWERVGEVPDAEGRAKAPARMLAALRAAGVEIAAKPRPAVFFGGKAA